MERREMNQSPNLIYQANDYFPFESIACYCLHSIVLGKLRLTTLRPT